MKRKMFFGLTAAAMLMVAPTASAGYWTGHGEILKDLIETWILNHGSTVAPKANTGAKQAAPAAKPGSARAGVSTDARR